MKRRRSRLQWVAWFVGLTVGATAAEFRVVGTDLLGLEFTREFSAQAARQGTMLRLAFDGSRSGLEAVTSGRADFALLVPANEEKSVPGNLKAMTFAYHVVAVLVPTECPVNAVTMDQLAGVFGAPVSDAGTKVPRWGDLGAIGEWNVAPITPLVPDAGSGITAEFFRKVVLHGGAWRSQTQRYGTAAELENLLRGESRAMALAAGTPRGSVKVKTLAIARTSRTPAVAPTAETVHSGAYPLCLPVQAVFRADRADQLSALLGYLFSPGAAGVFERASLLPLPATARDAAWPARDLKAKQSK